MRKIILIITVLFILSFITPSIFCDVVYFDGKKIEGEIIKETESSIIIETTIGKVTLDKEKVKKIERTNPEENFFKKGNYYFEQNKYDAAIDYYNRALEINPDYTKAKKALNKARRIKEKEELGKLLEIRRIKEKREKAKEKLEKKRGLVIDEIDGEFKVVHVMKNSASYKAQLKNYDHIIIIGDFHTKDMSFEKAHELLVEEAPLSLTIEREVNLVRKRLTYKKRTFVGVGIFVIKDKQDLVIVSVLKNSPADEAGIKPKDEIINIDSRDCKSLSLDECEDLISDSELTTVNILIKRRVKVK